MTPPMLPDPRQAPRAFLEALDRIGQGATLAAEVARLDREQPGVAAWFAEHGAAWQARRPALVGEGRP